MDSEFRKALETLALSHDTQKKAVSHQLHGRRQAQRAGRLRRREPDLEDQLSAGARQEGEAVSARLGRGREPDRRGLEGRAHGPGLRPADLLPDGPVSAAVRPPPRRRAGTVRLPAAADLLRRPEARAMARGGDKQQELREEAERPEPSGHATASEKAADAMAGEAASRRTRPWRLLRRRGRKQLDDRMDLGSSVGSAATAAKLGDFFQYAIDKPVSLPRQKSAMLPIVDKDVEGQPRLHLQRARPRPSSRCWASSSRTPPACT